MKTNSNGFISCFKCGPCKIYNYVCGSYGTGLAALWSPNTSHLLLKEEKNSLAFEGKANLRLEPEERPQDAGEDRALWGCAPGSLPGLPLCGADLRKGCCWPQLLRLWGQQITRRLLLRLFETKQFKVLWMCWHFLDTDECYSSCSY